MSVTELLHIGMRYLKVGILLSVLFLLLLFVGYFVIYRKICKGKKKLPLGKLLWWTILITYLIVVAGATLLFRGGFWESEKVQPLFYAYRDAWVHWSAAGWRNIILNFCMFIPLGFWLPVGLRFFRKSWRTYLAGFGVTLFIEMTQLLARRGIFELDDVLGNTVGTMIGYGLFSLGFFFWSKVRKKESGRVSYAMAAQLPLLLTVLAFAIIFIRYDRQELGNNPNGYLKTVNEKRMTLGGKSDFDASEVRLPVYKVGVLTVQEAKIRGERFFQGLNTKLDDGETIVYDNTLVLYSEDRRCSLWMDYKGGTYHLNVFDVIFPVNGTVNEAVAGAAEDAVREALEQLRVFVPVDAAFEELGNGRYQFTVNMMESGDALVDGTLTCRYYGDFGIGDLNNNMISCVPYKDFPAISEAQAYEKIARGEFYYGQVTDLDVQVKSCEVKYEIDSKGYYQPNYCFTCIINGGEGEIMIPALK